MFEVSELVDQTFISRRTKEILYVNTNFMDVDQYKKNVTFTALLSTKNSFFTEH